MSLDGYGPNNAIGPSTLDSTQVSITISPKCGEMLAHSSTQREEQVLILSRVCDHPLALGGQDIELKHIIGQSPI